MLMQPTYLKIDEEKLDGRHTIYYLQRPFPHCTIVHH